MLPKNLIDDFNKCALDECIIPECVTEAVIRVSSVYYCSIVDANKYCYHCFALLKFRKNELDFEEVAQHMEYRDTTLLRILLRDYIKDYWCASCNSPLWCTHE